MFSTAVANKQGVVHECGGRRGGRGGTSCCGNMLSGGVVVGAVLCPARLHTSPPCMGPKGPASPPNLGKKDYQPSTPVAVDTSVVVFVAVVGCRRRWYGGL